MRCGCVLHYRSAGDGRSVDWSKNHVVRDCFQCWLFRRRGGGWATDWAEPGHAPAPSRGRRFFSGSADAQAWVILLSLAGRRAAASGGSRSAWLTAQPRPWLSPGAWLCYRLTQGCWLRLLRHAFDVPACRAQAYGNKPVTGCWHTLVKRSICFGGTVRSVSRRCRPFCWRRAYIGSCSHQ